MKNLGVLLLALGIMALVYQGYTYTTRETVIDIGPIHATAEKEETVPIPPIVGGALVIAGAVLLYIGGKNAAKI